MLPRVFPMIVTPLVALGCLGLNPAPAQAAGPNLPVDVTSVEVTSNELSGNVVLPEGTAILTIQTRYSECIQGGACGDKATLMEVTVGQASRSCQGLNGCNAAWQPGGRRQSFQVDLSAYRQNYIRENSPTLASLGLVNLPAQSWIGVSVRLRNPAGWSQALATSIQVAKAIDPADTLPTNLTAPELGSYGQSMGRDLGVDRWIDFWNVGRWASGAVTPATAIRVQVARCPDAACRLTPAQYEASGLTNICNFANNNMATQDLNCRPNPWTDITAADTCWRGRTQAQNRKGWSAWTESAVKCLPGVNAAGGGANIPAQGACPLCRPDSPILDVTAVAPFRPGVPLGDLVLPSVARLPVFTVENNPVQPVAAQAAVINGTAYGAGGSTWRLPAGWRAPDLQANTTFTLFACATTDRSSCQAVGSWPASRLVGQSPILNSTGALSVQAPYARIAQTSSLINARGIETDQTALSEWVSVTTAAPAPSPTPTPTPTPSPTPSGSTEGGSSSADAPAAVDIPPALVAAGVDGRITPLVGTNGEGTYRGVTLKVQVPTVEPRGVKINASATVTPRTKGKVWFTFTRTLPNGQVRVDRTRKVTVRGTRARTSWTFAASKPTGTYLLIVRFVPSTKGKVGAMVTKAILVK